MTDQEEHDRAGTMSLKDMREWLKDEARDSAKAHELRVKDAAAIVDAYAAGQIGPQEVNERLYQYDKRWGEALYGTSAGPGVSDEAILKAIDTARAESLGREAIDLKSGKSGAWSERTR